MPYSDDEMLMLSGIQHYMFCPRQWALIDIEQQWDENRLTIEGDLLHERVDNPFYRQKNGDVITMRRVPIVSYQLGLSGLSDAVELHPSPSESNSICHPNYPGWWQPYPVEYKRGKPKYNEMDEVQLAAQVMCLEEMYGIHIPQAALYYGETRHHCVIAIHDDLRALVVQCAQAMHEIYQSQITPPAIKKRHCRNCSLVNRCMPELSESQKASNYLKTNLYADLA